MQQDKTDIDRAIVRAPVDGVVLQVNVRPGELVGANPGSALVVLGSITDHVNIRVDIDEHDIPRFKAGAAGGGQPAQRTGQEVSAHLCPYRAVCHSEKIADRRQHRAGRYPRDAGDLLAETRGQADLRRPAARRVHRCVEEDGQARGPAGIVREVSAPVSPLLSIIFSPSFRALANRLPSDYLRY